MLVVADRSGFASVTPLIPGTTGLSTPVPIEDVAILPADSGAPAASGDPNTGVGLAIAVLAVLFAIIVVALVVPSIRRRRPPAEEATADTVRTAIRALDKAVNKGIIHRNNAARRKSRLIKKLNRATVAS